MSKSNEIQLGAKVKHRSSAFAGTLTGRRHLHASTMVRITADALGENGKPVTKWFDECDVESSATEQTA